ncbi:MAG: hypothetical protein AB8G86_09380 [Saprospiraceae bacterium]
MTERDILLEIKLIKDQLKLCQLYPDSFTKNLGHRGLDDFINERLERLKYLIEILKNLKDEEN